jgi:hypothetical protein
LLLRDKRDGKLYKDDYLVKNNALYAQLDKKELANYVLTLLPGLPVSAYAGKVATINAYISQKQPLLVGGDSPNDFMMLSSAKNKLWITRLDKSDYLHQIKEQTWAKKNILFQPVLNSQFSGFYSTKMQVMNIVDKCKANDKIQLSLLMLISDFN